MVEMAFFYGLVRQQWIQAKVDVMKMSCSEMIFLMRRQMEWKSHSAATRLQTTGYLNVIMASGVVIVTNQKLPVTQFRDNRIAIAIEHGQHNEISFNIFSKDKEAIRLWARKEQPADWGYAKYRDTRSVDYTITGNSFNGNPTAINLNRTDSINIFENTYSGFLDQLKFDSTVTNIDSVEIPIADAVFDFPKVKAPVDPFKAYASFAGRKNILITEWGPYDFRYPIIWNTNPVDSSDAMTFNLIGPKGRWVIKNSRGVQNISMNTGEFPSTITAQKISGDKTDILIELEYTGSSITTPFGETIPAQSAV